MNPEIKPQNIAFTPNTVHLGCPLFDTRPAIQTPQGRREHLDNLIGKYGQKLAHDMCFCKNPQS